MCRVEEGVLRLFGNWMVCRVKRSKEEEGRRKEEGEEKAKEEMYGWGERNFDGGKTFNMDESRKVAEDSVRKGQ